MSSGKPRGKKAVNSSSGDDEDNYNIAELDDEEDEIMSSSRSKRGSRSRSRSNASIRGAATKNLKKRRYEEISDTLAGLEECKGPKEGGMLWVDKYAPKSLVRLVS